MTTTLQFNVIKCPSKFDLMTALFVGTGLNNRHIVEFLLERDTVDIPRNISHGRLKVLIEEVGREDGSGESWNFCGYVPDADSEYRCVRGHFRTDNRLGWLEFINWKEK